MKYFRQVLLIILALISLVFISFFYNKPKIVEKYGPPIKLGIELSNIENLHSKPCVIENSSISINSIEENLYAFCYNAPKNSTCLYLKAHNKIYLRSNYPERNCKIINQEKSCFVVDMKSLTCIQQMNPLK